MGEHQRNQFGLDLQAVPDAIGTAESLAGDGFARSGREVATGKPKKLVKQVSISMQYSAEEEHPTAVCLKSHEAPKSGVKKDPLAAVGKDNLQSQSVDSAH